MEEEEVEEVEEVVEEELCPEKSIVHIVPLPVSLGHDALKHAILLEDTTSSLS